MSPTFCGRSAAPALIACAFGAASPVQAYELSDMLSIGVILAPAGQCQDVSALLPSESYGTPLDETGDPLEEGTFSGAPPGGYDTSLAAFDNECRGAAPLQVEVSYHPDAANEFFFKLGFAVDNGLNPVSPWILVPWAADLEDDVEDINGRNRDYLLTAWYKYTHAFGKESALGATIGIIDSTDYIDANAYANDEYTQFMNEVFVNSGSHNLASYDAGAALQWTRGQWALTALGMNIGENDDGNNYNFWGVELGYFPQTPPGAGGYRLTLSGTSSAFLDPAGEENESLLGYGLSFDQEFGEFLGGFLRFSWQEEDAAVDYRSLYSGGLDLNGSAWNRDGDNIGIGYAYLEGGNQDVGHTRVFEAYYRAVLNDYTALTADLQYLQDDLEESDPRQDDPDGWIFGLRLTAEF